MKLASSLTARLITYVTVLFAAAYTAHAAPVLYTFTATTRASPSSPSHLEQFQLLVPDYLPLVLNGGVLSFLRSDPELISCVACTDPPIPTLHFLRANTSDLVQFRDADGTLRPYFFPANSLSIPGTYDTLPGINVLAGRIVVAETPEPSTVALVIAGTAILALRRRSRTPELPLSSRTFRARSS